MNAKKIMGAVLVALLALTAFAGVGAAANVGPFFAYETGLDGTKYNGVWQNGANTVTVAGGEVSDVLVAGTYKLGDYSAYFTKPTATYVANAKYGDDTYYIVSNNGNVYANSNLTITVTPVAKNTSFAPDKIRIEYPNGEVKFEAFNFFNGADVIEDAGTYKVQAVWSEDFNNFVTGAPKPVVDANVFTFTVIKPSDATISAAVDTVFAGDVVGVTIKGTPGEEYNLFLTGIDADEQNLNQIVTLDNYTNKTLNFTMPNVGAVTFQLETEMSADEIKIELATVAEPTKVIGDVEIKVANPTYTATLGAASYFIGDKIKLTLTSDIGLDYTDYDFKIAGTNFRETAFPETSASGFKGENNGKSFTVTLPTAGVNDAGKKLDVGTYSIKIYSGDKVVKTVAVALKQPFISIVEAPEVVVKATDADFVVNAEATTQINYYIFGTNYFYSPDNFVSADKDVPNKFKFTLGKNTVTNNMAPGQYFMVLQHPMYDGYFNILDANKVFYLNTEGNADDSNTYLFSTDARQTANAAQALCDALDSQNIDDMYVKYSFFVVGEDQSFSISDIPTSVVKGDKIVISGVDTASEEGTPVTVEMISTAFAAVPKETVGSAAFIVVTTEVAKDGTWEVTLDTSDLNVDEYSLSVAIDNAPKKTVTVNVVEGADEPVNPEQPEEPEQPENPEQPEAPATPGFGALAALAGLGAVAVLLLRRE